MTNSRKIGVIKPVSKEMDTSDIKAHIKIPNASETSIIDIERLKYKKDNEWKDSLSLKITFDGILPEAVVICHSYYRVIPYVGRPLQCF